MAKFAFFGTQATVLDMVKLAQGRVHVLEAVMGQLLLCQQSPRNSKSHVQYRVSGHSDEVPDKIYMA